MSKFSIDARVNWFGIKPEMAVALDRVIALFFRSGFDCRITSAIRPATLDTFSLHPFGYAFDAVPDAGWTKEYWERLRFDLAHELGPQFDVLAHDAGSGMHMHVEFDPKDNEAFQTWKARERKAWAASKAPKSPVLVPPSSPFARA